MTSMGLQTHRPLEAEKSELPNAIWLKPAVTQSATTPVAMQRAATPIQ
jgi:hypothetical protein